tara:strand:- start:5194 stop:5880 length:687 start_codon:yes stop_codon:yes gene_type:complete
MKFISFFLITILNSQNYQLFCYGLHTTDIKQTFDNSKKIKFEIKNIGLIDVFFPVNNSYSAIFDSSLFFVRSWKKDIEQGKNKTSLSAKLDSSEYLIYNNNKKLKIKKYSKNIFSLLAMAQTLQSEFIDTKWFPFEHQGSLGKARFLWSDSNKVWDGKDSILCDHYRLDIKITDSTQIVKIKNDYFMDNIYKPGIVKELWIRRKPDKRIIKASAKTPWISFIAKLNEK